MMDTPIQYDGNPALTLYQAKQSDLEKYILTSDNTGLPKDFNSTLSDYLNVKNTSRDHLNYKAIVWYRKDDGTLGKYDFSQSASMTGREHFVRVTRLVTLEGRPPTNLLRTPPIIIPADMRPVTAYPNFNQTVLMDVTIWRD
jgi:hypothetical protein